MNDPAQIAKVKRLTACRNVQQQKKPNGDTFLRVLRECLRSSLRPGSVAVYSQTKAWLNLIYQEMFPICMHSRQAIKSWPIRIINEISLFSLTLVRLQNIFREFKLDERLYKLTTCHNFLHV